METEYTIKDEKTVSSRIVKEYTIVYNGSEITVEKSFTDDQSLNLYETDYYIKDEAIVRDLFDDEDFYDFTIFIDKLK